MAFCKKTTQVIFNFLICIEINKNYSCNFYSTWICFSLFKFWFFYNTFDSATYILWVYCLKAPEEVILCLTWLSYMYTMWVNIIYFPPRHSASQIFCFIPGLSEAAYPSVLLHCSGHIMCANMNATKLSFPQPDNSMSFDKGLSGFHLYSGYVTAFRTELMRG